MSVSKAIEDLRAGKMVIMVDDEDRENEGDLVLAADYVTPAAINFMVTHARGLVCLSMPAEQIDRLQLPLMTNLNHAKRSTAFTVSIEAREGVSTGISAQDRAHTIRVAASPSCQAGDVVSPGHVFPLRAVDGGVLVRAGHTEGSVDLVRASGLNPSAVICEIMNEDGTMARLPELRIFAEKFGLTILSIRDLIEYRMSCENLAEEIARTKFPSQFGEFELIAFRNRIDESEHVALVKGNIESTALVRVHSECLTGDALGSLRCDCGAQLQAALKQISEAGSGALLYIRKHEGRGIGLGNKIRAYSLQDQGMDTVEANRHLGFKDDLRQYGLGAQILKRLGIQKLRLLTNNPRKIVGLDGYGLEVVERVPLEVGRNEHNSKYLDTKKSKLGHDISGEG